MNKKDYYSILDIPKNASEEEIKKSYKKLALLYHPDKTGGDPAATEKFKEVSEAYSVLSNVDKKRQYDMLGEVDDEGYGEDPFSVFNNIFKQHVSSFMNMKYDNDINIANIFSNLSGAPEESFPFNNVHIRVHTFPTDGTAHLFNVMDDDEEDTDNEKVVNPFQTLFSKIGTQKKKKEKITKIIHDKPENIVYEIKVTLEDLYNKTDKEITIKRMRKKGKEYFKKTKKVQIPIYDKEVYLIEQGDELENYKNKGDIVINIFTKKDKNFKRINEYDILTTKEITVNKIYDSFLYDLVLPNGEVIKIETEKLVDNKYNSFFQKVTGKGIPYKKENELSYGNLYIMYKIKYPKTKEELGTMFGNMFKIDPEEDDSDGDETEDAEEDVEEDAEEDATNKTEENNNTYFTSCNCNYEDILKDE